MDGMSSPNRHSDVTLTYGEYADRIKGLGQKDWIAACVRLGLCVRKEAGRGAHAVAYTSEEWPPSADMVVVTMATKFYPQIQRATLKKVVGYGVRSGRYTELDVWRALGIKIKIDK